MAFEYEVKGTILKAEHVSVALSGVPILRDVNLEVKDIVRPGKVEGQVVGLLGPSGMGKTTLFRVLAGLDRPDAGQVLLGDEGKPVERGMVGVVAQNYPLFGHRTVLGNLLVAGAQSGLSGEQAKARAMDYLRRFDLEGQARHYPPQLSGGQRQRVAIAQQFMCSENLLLLDEPFSGLDVLAAARVIQFVKDMASLNDIATFILVTHDNTAAIQVGDPILLLGRHRD